MKKYLLMVLFIVGCASMGEVIPQLKDRTLDIDPDKAGLKYQYKVCDSTFLGICTSHKMHIDYYDLTDPLVRRQLIDIGFVAKVRTKSP